MIIVNNVSKGFGGRLLFENVNVSFSPGHNYGLTGPNGSGKSTFMKILIGAEDTDKGSINRPQRTAWLRQDHSTFDTYRVLDVVIMGNKRLWEAMQEKEHIYAKPDITDEDGVRLGDLECVVAEEDGYTAEAEAAILLEGLGIGQELQLGQMSDLVPGLKLRVLVAQALFGRPEALLLDEPTNHLDLDSIRWLEDFLIAYDGVLVVISHDRRFLNAICDHIADIDYQTIITYVGNYDDMIRAKSQIRSRVEKENDAKEKKIAQLQDFISRFKAGTRSSQTRSRARQVERLKPEEIKRSNVVRPYIRFSVGDPSGKEVLRVQGLSKGYDRPIFDNLHLQVRRGDKIVVIGRNGIGKSTLVKTLVGEIEPDTGVLEWGHNVRVGYFPESHEGAIAPGTTVYQWLFAHRPAVGEQEVRAILGRMLFSGADGAKPTATLSGGERVRLLFCKLILLEYNVLVLDEPTNHLDLESISSLKEAIEAYEGTILYVTHDRELGSAANRVLAYPAPGELIDYDGPIDDYLAWYDQTRKTA